MRGGAAMRLCSLTLRRFRSHELFERRFDGRPVAVYGPNGAGKTNILEAISQLSPGRGLRGAKVDEMAMRPDPIGWSVAAEIHGPLGAGQVRVSADLRDGAARRIEIDGAGAPQAALGDRLRMVWLTPAMDRLWIEGASERRRFLDRTTLAFDPAHAARAARYERAMRERNRLLKEPGARAEWLDAVEAQMAELGLRIAAARVEAMMRLKAAYNDAKTLFPRAEISVNSEGGEMFAAPPPGFDASPPEGLLEQARRALRDSRRMDSASGRSSVGSHRSDLEAVYAAKAMPARACSTGEQKALLISLTLATARALRAPEGEARVSETGAPLLLLDEVAAHLDSERRSALFDEICALGAQAWMTGTGPELFEGFGDRAETLALGALSGARAPGRSGAERAVE